MFFGTTLALFLILNVGVDEAFHQVGDLLFYPASVEERAELRVKTERTRTDEHGETQPVYELRQPEPGATFVRVELLLASEVPRKLNPDEVVLVDEDGLIFAPEMATVDLRLAPRETVDVDGPIDLKSKVALELIYEVPAADWANLTLYVEQRSLCALAPYIRPGSRAEVSAESGKR